MLKASKYRIYPNENQVIIINKTFGCARFVYNKMLRFKQDLYKQTSISYSKIDCNDWCNRVLKEEYKFLKEVDKFALTNAIYNMDNAYNRFFKSQAMFPKYKRKHTNYSSYTTNYTNNNITLDYENNKIKLPKLGKVKAKLHRKIDGKIKNATITKTASDKYYVSIIYESKDNIKAPKTDNKIGIDLGIKNLVITSNKEKYNNPCALKKYQDRLITLQRSLSKKKKGSNNYNKLRKRIATYHEKITNIRKDNLHKISHKLVNENQVIVTEDLYVKNMVKNHQLASFIEDASFGELVRQLEYKSKWYGRTLIKIDKFYPSSQICHVCGNKNKDVKDLSIRKWNCCKCNTLHDRDINAAINILKEGLRMLKA